MKKYYGSLTKQELKRYTEFNGRPIAIPENISYTFIFSEDEKEILGVLTSRNYREGFRKANRRIAFSKMSGACVCEHPYVPPSALEAKVV